MTDTRDIRLFAFTSEERGALKMLINTEMQRLMGKTPRNETMINVFQNVLNELKKGRPLS